MGDRVNGSSAAELLDFPTPQEIGLPSKFKLWRPNQPRVIMDSIGSKKRVKIQLQEAGDGKTVSYMSVPLLKPNMRAVICTVNKQLQDQLYYDFNEIGVADLRGRSTYDCVGRPGYNCEIGALAKCPFKGSDVCPADGAKSAAFEADIVSTNYACWTAANHYGQGLGKRDLLILDEAHEAPTQLANAMQVRVTEHDVDTVKVDWPDHRSRKDMESWKHWSMVTQSLADTRLAELDIQMSTSGGAKRLKRGELDRLRALKNMSRKLADIAVCKASNWVVEEQNNGYVFDVVDAGQFAERILFNKIPSVIATSGTIQPAIIEDLNIDPDDYDFFTYQSNRNPARSPFYWLKTLSMNRHVQDWEIVKRIVGRIDEIIEERIDRKGIIHTANKHIRDLIMQHSRFKKYMVSNQYGQWMHMPTGQLVEDFKRMQAPVWFTSASLGTGVDLIYDQCRVQIVAKLPFGDRGSKVEEAREELDKLRGMKQMFQRLAQQFGRALRAEDDWQELFCLDDLLPWAMWKFADLVPPSITPYYRPITSIPPAPEML